MKIQKQNTKYKKNLKQLLNKYTKKYTQKQQKHTKYLRILNNNKKELRVLKILEQN